MGCIANLKAIGEALKRFEDERGRMPRWLHELVDEGYLDPERLICPADLLGGRSGHAFYYSPTADPKLPCSYLWEFNPSAYNAEKWIPTPMIPPPGEVLTWEVAKKIQRGYFGDVVPVVRCWHHIRRYISLCLDGRIRESGDLFWEASDWGMEGFFAKLEERLISEPGICYDRYDPQRIVQFFEEQGKLERLISFLKLYRQGFPDNPWIPETLKMAERKVKGGGYISSQRSEESWR